MKLKKSFQIGHEAWWIWTMPFLLGAAILSICYAFGLDSNLCLSIGLMINVLMAIAFVIVYVLIPSTIRIYEGLKIKRIREAMKTYDENVEEKPLAMTKENFIIACNQFMDDTSEDEEEHFHFVGLSVFFLLQLNNIENKDNNFALCSGSAAQGWEAADHVMQRLEQDGELWDEKSFDRVATSEYLHCLSEEKGITDMKMLQLIRWAYNYGASMRVKYDIEEEYKKAFLKGDMYDVKISFISDKTIEIINNIDNGTLDITSEATKAFNEFRSLFELIVDEMGTQRIKDVVASEPECLGFFVGGLIVSSMTHGHLDVSNLPHIDEEDRKRLQEIYDLYLQHIAGTKVIELNQKIPIEGFSIFVLGIYCNQLIDGDQLLPYTFDFEIFGKALHGDVVAKVMMFVDNQSKT